MKTKEKINKVKHGRQTSIITIFLWLFLITTMIIIVATGIKNNNAIENSELYDKIYIESATIEERKTGTGPFTTNEDGSIPDVPEPGHDYSEDDNYVRTFDTVNYNVSAILSPNVDIDGITEETVLYGGTIKVKATLPSVNGKSHFKWITQAWMKNVTLSEDGRTLYAEYNIADSQRSAPGAQNLTFEMKADGYVTQQGEQAPKPTFEIWMEGNKEDNEESTKEKVILTDENELYITGKNAINIRLAKGQINHRGEYNGRTGVYVNYGIAVSLYQTESQLGDLRGLEYPIGEINTSMDLTYQCRNVTKSEEWQILTGEDNVQLVGYALNGVNNDSFWPASNLTATSVPQYKGNDGWRCADAGEMSLTLTNNTMNISFSNYLLNGHFPTMNVASGKEGCFTVGNIELFMPDMETSSEDEYQYSLNVSTKSLNYETMTKPYVVEYIDNVLKDVVTTDNDLTWTRFKSDAVKLEAYTENVIYGQSSETVADASALLGSEITYHQCTIISSSTLGGLERFVTWRADALTLQKYNSQNWIGLSYLHGSVTAPLRSDAIFEYGVYKEDKENGITNDADVNGATFDSFDWYSTPEEVLNAGYKIAAIRVDEPKYLGFQQKTFIELKFKVTSDVSYINQNYIVRSKVRAYSDEERTIVSELATQDYTKGVYENGILKKAGSWYGVGTDFLIVPHRVTAITSVEDLASDNKPKTTYDVQDRIINFNITPKLESLKADVGADNEVVDKVQVTDYLPKGLSYVEGSSNKEPISVTLDPQTGITTIIWEYENWSTNQEAPGYPKITFQAKMSYTLKNNQKIENRVVVSTAGDWSRESVRTAKYGITIANLAGIGIEKSTDTPVVERNTEMMFNTNIASGKDEDITNARVLEILPYNGDENGSSFHGTYVLKSINLPEDVIGYYTTLSIDKLESEGGLIKDENGKLSAANVDFMNNHNWKKIENLSVDQNITALIFVKDLVTSESSTDISYTILPKGNKEEDLYVSSASLTLDKFAGIIKSNIQIVRVKDTGLTVDIEAVKVWNDDNNAYGKRPEEVTLVIKNGEQEVASQKVTEKEEWRFLFINLARYDENGNEILYSVDEKETNEYYEKSIDGYQVVNTYIEKVVANTSDVNIWIYLSIFLVAIIGVVVGMFVARNNKRRNKILK
ncbi:MAG: Cna B-type domain-containing protein [Clostridia bacterium]|nr:Cna B-type domain-containing protein [Clostridia bacterium]